MQLFRQNLSGPVKPGLHGSGRNMHQVRNLLNRQLLHMEECETLTVVVTKSINRSLNLFANRTLRGLTVRDGFRRVLNNDRSAIASLQGCPAPVRSNPHQPRFNGATLIPRRQMSNRSYDRFLRHIFRILPMTHHLKAEGENQLLATFDECPQSVSVTRQASTSEFVEIVHPSQVRSSVEIPGSFRLGFRDQARRNRKSQRTANRQCLLLIAAIIVRSALEPAAGRP